MWWKIWVGLMLLWIGASPLSAQSQSQEHFGNINEKALFARYHIKLELGQGAVALVEATTGDLDTQLFIYDADAVILAYNDDRRRNDLNSEVAFIADYAGTYTIEVTSYGGTMGDYRLQIDIVSADAILDTSRMSFSGTPQVHDTPNFRIHYTATGIDSATEDYIQLVGETMEEIYQLQIIDMGWRPPPIG